MKTLFALVDLLLTAMIVLLVSAAAFGIPPEVKDLEKIEVPRVTLGVPIFGGAIIDSSPDVPPVPPAVFVKKELQAFADATFPGQIRPRSYKNVFSEDRTKMHKDWLREPTTKGIIAMSQFLKTTEGRQIVRDLADPACTEFGQLLSASSTRFLRACMLTLAADRGRDRELVWFGMIVILNPDGAQQLGEQIELRHPAIQVLGSTARTIVDPDSVPIQELGRVPDAPRFVARMVDVSILQHRNAVLLDSTDAEVAKRADDVCRKYGLRK